MKQDFKLITKLWRSLLVFLCLLATTTAWAGFNIYVDTNGSPSYCIHTWNGTITLNNGTTVTGSSWHGTQLNGYNFNTVTLGNKTFFIVPVTTESINYILNDNGSKQTNDLWADSEKFVSYTGGDRGSETYPDVTPAVTISPSETSHNGTVTVTLSGNDYTSDIYYTTDGSTPTTSSTKYTGLFTLSGNGDHTVKALAVNSLKSSAVATTTYTIGYDTYYAKGDNTSFFPAQWSNDDRQKMTTTDGINYTWTSGEVTLPANSTISYKVHNATQDSWHPSGANAQITTTAAGTYVLTITYTVGDANPTATLSNQAAPRTFTVYARSTDEGVLHAYIYGDPGEANGNWATAIAAPLATETLADGLTWYKYQFTAQSSNYNLILYNSTTGKQTVDINGITDDTRYVVMLHDDLNAGKCNVTSTTLPPTAKMYVIGQAGGNPWATNSGLEMVKDPSTGKFKLENVQILAGSQFAFVAALTGENEWSELNKRRLTSNASAGTSFELTDAFTDKDNPVELALRLHDGTNDRNFKADETAYYDITLDPVTLKATIVHKYGSLYMFYGDSNSEHWKPNNGEPMITTDGDTYTLSGVTLKVGDTFQFATQLSQSATDWNSIADYRIGSNATTGDWMVQPNYINKPLNALEKKSTKNFKMDIGTAGIYRVIVNLTDMTVTLKDMAKVLDGVTIIHLEKTPNVTDPVLHAYDKETLPDGTRIHVDRPLRHEIATNRKGIQFSVKNDTITADNRSWWTWEVDNAIVDFWFTRGDYYYPNHLTDESNPDMTDIQWRMAGELYLTWDNDGVTMSDYTRDYYAAAAQEAADCAVMIEGHYYAYFTNTPGWDNVFCHAWYTDANGTNHDLLTPPSPYTGDPVYPGALCELVGYDKDGYEVWRCDLTAQTNGAITTENAPVGIIFNNGIDIGNNEVKTDYATGQTYAENDPEYENVIKEQTGDFVYSNGACYDYCGVIVLGRSLGNIIRNGIVDGPVYTIEEDLVGVYFDESAVTKIEVEGGEPQYAYGALYCKDQNNFVSTKYVEKSLQKEGETDYIIGTTDLMGSKTRHDQSNWVKLTLSTQYPGFNTMTPEQQKNLLSSYVNKVLPASTVNGQLVNNYNPEMRLALQELPELNDCRTSTYSADDNVNVFVTGSFVGSQVGGPEGHAVGRPYFFVTPKPQEYALITWAVYGGNDEFFVPTCHTYTNTNYFAWMNEPDLNGYFKVKWDLMNRPTWIEDGVDGNGQYTGQAYKFHAIIRLADESTTESDTRRRAESQPYKPGVAQSKYIVSPIDISNEAGWVVTAVTDLQSTKSVKAVRYYNVAGMVSDTPFDGMNIVVTEYNDGTQQTSKAVY